jgi:hypothetical protein
MMNQTRVARNPVVRRLWTPRPDELLGAADEALYDAKLQGRDRVVTDGPRLLPLTAQPGQVKGRAARVE